MASVRYVDALCIVQCNVILVDVMSTGCAHCHVHRIVEAQA